MIISTNKADALLKRALGKGQSSIITIDKMIDQFQLDPRMTNPVRSAYVITNEDISATRIKARFEQAVAAKHEATKIIFINKSTKPMYANGLNGIDAILQKPNANDIVAAISTVIEQDSIDAAVAKKLPNSVDIPDYHAPVHEQPEAVPIPIPEPTPVTEEPPEDIPIPVPEPQPEPPVEEFDSSQSRLAQRIMEAGSVSDINVITREIQASVLIKNIIDENSTYAGIEEKLKSLNDVIFTIMSDTRIPLDEKLSKVRAVLHDKAFFAAKGDTIIEQYLEDIVELVCSRTCELLQSRLDEIDTAIQNSKIYKGQENDSARLSGINEERANLIMELRTLEIEIADIYKNVDKAIISGATFIAQRSNDPTGNEMINMRLKASGQNIVSDDTLTAVRLSLELANKVPDVFKELHVKVVAMIQVLNKLFDYDQEIIAAQQAIIQFLRAKNVEDTVVANTLLKQSLRVFVGEEAVGRTIIPYLLSRYKSRQNANVLLVDLTGTGKYARYGINTMPFDQFMSELNQKEFLVVSGSVSNTVETAQNIITTLLKAADYYKVINVVLSPEQEMLFHTIAEDVRCVNYLTDTNVTNIESMRDFIASTKKENVGRRVIINRCDVAMKPIITQLGLDNEDDFQVCNIQTIPVLSDAGLRKYNPYGISAVDLAMEEVIKHA